MFSHLLHIRPWEADRLTARQFDLCVEYVDDFLSRADDESEDTPDG